MGNVPTVILNQMRLACGGLIKLRPESGCDGPSSEGLFKWEDVMEDLSDAMRGCRFSGGSRTPL